MKVSQYNDSSTRRDSENRGNKCHESREEKQHSIYILRHDMSLCIVFIKMKVVTQRGIEEYKA